MASSTTSWMPPVGKYPVAVGSSLGRALKARNNKGVPPPAPPGKRGIPTKDYFSFRYNFQPPSTDSNKQGNIEMRTIVGDGGKEGRIGTMQKASTQPGEGHQFGVLESPPKEFDCVVIFDEETMSFTLEKLDSTLQIKYEQKISMPGTPVPTVNPPPTQTLDFEAELERELLGEDDADGEIDTEVVSTSITLRQEEEEEEGEMTEEIIIPPPPPKPKPRKSAVPPPGKPRQPAKAAPASTPAPPPAPTPAPPPVLKPAPAPPVPTSLPPKPKPKPKPVPVPRVKKPKREPSPVSPPSHPLADADEEDLQFGRPAKRARPSPPSEGLALPGVSTSIYTPPPPVSAPPPKTGGKRLANLPPPMPAPASESEEEWDEVVDVTKDEDVEDDFDIFGDAAAASAGGEEIDVNAFEMELNMQMEESDDDFLAAAVSPEPDDEPVRGMPISLKQLAAGTDGVAGYASEDEYSSSEESDDD
ncbi:hypothetical protein BDZ94DRAFT_504128 [Collybia nuda]|uniref:Transcription elongation factor Eaf N-terminal domain-containing protein n=1 Tax=Collybia nuda TaxID=64659 RepID=A0A9P6CJE8_9AGAR|nr:hypothetical protein BDZ94DRAFT_504128 [Collybia nuda]